jgi:hypothetical protein
MSDEPRETARRPSETGLEQKGAAEWIAAGSGVITAVTSGYQALKPSGQVPPPQPEKPEVILPPGVDHD